MAGHAPYTCSDYRAEMILMGLVRRLNQEALSDAERERLVREIGELKKKMGMD